MPAPSSEEVIQRRAKALAHVVSQWRADPESGKVTADDLAKLMDVSKKTANDLIHELDEVFRHVRASPRADALEWGGTTYYEKSLGHNRELKQEIASKFVEMIPSTPSIACSAGSTVTYCVREINETGKPAHIVTNNLGIVREWRGVEEGLDLTGGTYDHETNALSGEAVIQTFQELRCSVGLIGVSGVGPDGRLFVKHRWEAKYRAAIVNSVSNEIYICTDVEKLGNHDLWQFATIDEIVAAKPPKRVVLITNRPKALRDTALRQPAEKALASLQEIATKLGPERFEVVLTA
jgi:DeoR family glycerol-3-phosphate regulon repressor